MTLRPRNDGLHATMKRFLQLSSPGGTARPSARSLDVAYGELVGEDEFGNRYYRTKGGKIDPSARLRAALGDLQRRTPKPRVAAGLARLAAPHRRRAADAGELSAAAWEKPHRPNLTGTPGATPDRLDPGAGPPPEGDRRLQGLDAGRTAREPLSRRLARACRPFPAVFPVLTGPTGRRDAAQANAERRWPD